MAPKGDASKDTIERSTGKAVQKTLVDFPVYADTELFIKNGSTLTQKHVNKANLAKSLKEDLGD